jgi:transcriptional regulator with XRE-family HTH domain
MEALFKTKPVRIDTLGDFLASYRRKLNLDIKTVSMLTQIKPTYIESLEGGNWEKLPAEVYTKGFLKQLAEVYHLPEEALIEQYQKEFTVTDFRPASRELERSRFYLNPKTLVVAFTVLVGLIVLGYVISQVRSVLAPPSLEISEPAADLSISGNSLIVSGKTELGADVFINNQTVLVDKNGQFAESLILSPGLNILEIRAVNKFGKESRINRKINTDITAATSKPVLAVNIVIEIGPEPAWIYLEADGAVVHRGTMLPGATKTISAQEEVLLTSANAGSTKVIYNGKDLGLLGRMGEVIRNVEFSATEVNETIN